MRRQADDSVGVTGLGMVAALGHDVVTNCAAARAGLSRAAELNVVNFAGDEVWGNEPVVGHTAGAIAEGFTGIGKLKQLAAPALGDLLVRASLPPEAVTKAGLYVACSAHFFGQSLNGEAAETRALNAAQEREAYAAFVGRLAADHGFDSEHHRVYMGGRTGAVQAFRDAHQAIQSGVLDRCVVGGVDSLVEPRVLEAAARHGLLKTAAVPDGFMPGEAAAFVLLERMGDARARGVRPTCVLEGVAIGRDSYDRLSGEPPIGRALAEVVAASLASCPGEEGIGFVIGDLNGDPFRASEWGYALTRLGRRWDLGTLPLWLPAVSFGEVGAASVAVAVCIAGRSFERGYAPAPRTLVWLVGDDGGRAAFRLGTTQVSRSA